MTVRRVGRPALDPSERRAQQLHVPVSPLEMAALVAWSTQAGRPIAVLVRETSLRAARRSRPVEPRHDGHAADQSEQAE